MRRHPAALVAAVLLLGGCAATEPDASGDPEVTASQAEPSTGKDGARDGDQGEPGADASDLADIAEDLAQDSKGDIPPRSGAVLGADISWPQCPAGMGIPEKRSSGQPMPIPDAEYVVVGLTNGPGFTPNPCLSDQVDWVEDHRLLLSAYAVASYPDDDTLEEYGDDGPFSSSTELGRLKNVGYQQARFNIGSMGTAGLQTPIVWIDVEPVPSFDWSADKQANAAVVTGVARGYTEAGYEVGVYSTPHLWEGVVGDFTLDGVPEWRAAGETSRAEATNRCGDDWTIQGGPGVLGQWVEARRDQNITCPGISADLGRWFHQT